MNGYFDREKQLANDPYLETREKEDAFLQRVLETVQQGVQGNPLNGLAALLQAAPALTQDNTAVEDDLDTAMDFINSLYGENDSGIAVDIITADRYNV